MEYDFEIRRGRLFKLDPASRQPIAVHEPLGTKVVQCVRVGGNVVVREDYYRYPQGSSNLYCLDRALSIVWKAELPTGTDAYANPVEVTTSGLVCASWECYTCTIDPSTGRIRSKVFTK